ncbi:MAG TPA: hypothetical protein VMZ28_00130 [Kofleriaceae bacterium]|nr:hypothetical protein [Kofleriaceae bacterium]
MVKIDYDAAVVCEPVPQTALPGSTAAVWLGGSYAAVWSETRDENTDLFFGLLDAAGTPTGATTRLTEDPGVSRVLSLVATDSGYGVLYEDDRDAAEIHHLYYAALDDAGTRVGDEEQIGALWGTDVSSGDKSSAVLVWNGTHFATAWIEDRDDTGDPEVYFARWTPDGVQVGADLRINTSDAAARDVALVGIGDGWGLAWSDTRDAAGDGNSEIYVLRLDADAQRVTPDDQRVTDDIAFSVRPALAWSGSEFGLAWVDNRTGDSELYFTRLDAAGLPAGDVLRLTEDPSPVETKETPALLHDTDGYALAWSDRREQEGSPNMEVYLARIDDEGVRIGDQDVRVTDSPADTRATDILRSGETFTVLGDEVEGEDRQGWIATVCPEM